MACRGHSERARRLPATCSDRASADILLQADKAVSALLHIM
jgi:hypothetical protein